MDDDIAIQREKAFDTAGIDFPAIERRFRTVNAGRLARTRQALRDRQQAFLDLLPLLFEINHPMLPGYAARNAPAGIPGYEPDGNTLHLAKRLAKSFQYRKSVLHHYPITAIYLMGSPGTVAYSEESDFDIWLCHDPGLDDEQVELLQQKATGVEKWAESLGLEVHFFLINPESFGQEQKALSSESSGTAQHNLLLEEFYRTGVLVAGRFPLWWLVPPQFEADYAAFAETLKLKRFKAINDTIDFGGLAHVPAEEFFGAAVWQLSKGIDSPYKSALKLLLIEAYAAEYPYIHLLSADFKKLVYEGEEDLDRLDPYLMMLDKVENYLKEKDEPGRLELARRCFYFKVDHRLSTEGSDSANWRRQLLNRRIRSWGWGTADLALADARSQWKVGRVTEERRTLFEALAASYRFLSEFARRYAGVAMISERDLTILGRKLYSAYERKAGKIELINRGIAGTLRESHLTIHEALDENRQPVWILYSGVVPPDRVRREKPLKRMRSIVELASWSYFNGILDENTAVAIYQRGSGFSTKDFGALFKHLRSHFPSNLGGGTVEDFARPARVEKAVLFVNMGISGADRTLLTRDVGHIGSHDAFSFGFNADNLIISIDQVLVTSWKEVMTHRFHGAKGVVECLRDYLKWSPPTSGQIPPAITAHGLSAFRGLTVSHRLQELFGDVISCYYGGKNPPETRYVLAIGRGYFVLQFENDALRYKSLNSFDALLGYLGSEQKAFSPVVVDRHALKDTVLPLLYSRNKPGYVQFFYRPVGSEVEIYVLDERGSLFFQRASFFSGTTLLNQYSRFFEAVLNRMNFQMQDGEAVTPAEGVEFFAIGRDALGQYLLDRKAPEFIQRDKRYFSLQVMVDTDESDRTQFTLYCDEKEFSTLEHGGRLFNAVVEHVLELRKSGQPYPIYITDISLARPVIGEQGTDRMQTVQFLKYKQRIEDQLNRAMERYSG